MEALKGTAGAVVWFAYFGMGIVQIAAIVTAMTDWLGWFFGIIATLVVAYIPIVGPIAGVFGAIDGWGWELWAAVLLFFWPYALFLLFIIFGALGSAMSSRDEHW